MPYFSVILPTYNRAHLLSKAIESMLAQTFTDWELLIVDDGSTDTTKELVAGYSDERIRYIYQENQERSVARNNGINQARGAYICFLDSDDYFLEKKLENLYVHIENSEEKLSLFYDSVLIEDKSIRVKQSIALIDKNESFQEFILMNTLFSQQISGPKTVFNQFKFNKDIRIGEDIELWCRIAKVYPFNPLVDSYQTVIVEHEERSINPKKTKAAKEHLSTLKYIFSLNSSKEISLKVRSQLKSNSYFNIAKYEMYNSRKFQAIIWVIKSILADRKSNQTKHKIYCLTNLFLNKIPKEYLNFSR